ncbi:unnamed protein product [Cladocopium goreaui]|uniref:Dual specificity protein phosphatase 1-A n=1 Tax=Cladocopium goreaui TaxID=2562237 RepID=A0A9P1GCP9_9DINO|nr:unnamed protein product [Cladocopium goreaui]
MATGTVTPSPPPDLLLQVEQEIAKLILANAQVLAKRCAEACVQQVWAAASSQAAVSTSLDLLQPPQAATAAEPSEAADVAVRPLGPPTAEAAAVSDSQPFAANDDEDLWGNFLQADADASVTSVKGNLRKGKGKGPPLPSNMQAPRSPAPKAASQGLVRRNSGMTELKARVEAEGLRKDREEAKEITDLDLSQLLGGFSRCPA